MRAHNRRLKGLRSKITESARLSEKCTKGVKKRAERAEFQGRIHHCIDMDLKRGITTSNPGPHLLWITL